MELDCIDDKLTYRYQYLILINRKCLMRSNYRGDIKILM